MSTSYWQVRKVLENNEYRVEFSWLMEDQRDIMSDSIRPSYGRNPDRNRIAAYKNGSPTASVCMEVPASIGNRCYISLNACDSGWESILDTAYLNLCAYHNDYDAYSDIFKDVYGIRPHYTQQEWEGIVFRARSE